MEFKRYNDIENSYRQKYIARFKEKHPNLDEVKFVALEKLHGANFQIAIDPDGTIEFCTRKRILASDEKFYNWQEAVKKLKLDGVINFARDLDYPVRLYGELFGKGINKGVEYQEEKEINFFDIKVDSVYEDFTFFENMMIDFELPMVPVIARDITLKEFLDFEVETLVSKILNKDGNIAEGIVGRPMDKEIFIGHDRLILKKKSKKFKENAERKDKAPKIKDPLVEVWRPLVLGYVTEARLNNLFSKMGLIEFPKQIGEYIREYMIDVRKDFVKDYPEYDEVGLTKRQDKDIFNFSKKIVPWLNNNL